MKRRQRKKAELRKAIKATQWKGKLNTEYGIKMSDLIAAEAVSKAYNQAIEFGLCERELLWIK